MSTPNSIFSGTMNDLQFSGNDPGAVLLGNFINYYEFHPPEERLQLLPNNLYSLTQGKHFVCLDIGCNSGDLTTKVYESILKSNTTKGSPSTHSESTCFMIGIDIDPTLIERAEEKNEYKEKIIFKCLNFMNDEERLLMLQECPERNEGLFDVIFCFSVTMWIHLNHGDDGLCKFLKEISDLGKMLVIEPQPWKCYRSAVKRLKRCQKVFPYFQQLKIRENIEQFIEKFLLNTCHFVKVYESTQNKWGRKLVLFARRDSSTKVNPQVGCLS